MSGELANWIVLLATLCLLVGAVAVVTLKNWIAVVAATSVVSLGAAAIFVMLRAPDVALTEAAVGAGLGGVIMALCVRRLGLSNIEQQAGGSQAQQEGDE